MSGTPVGLLIALEACARPGVDPEQVRAQILQLLRPGHATTAPGVFHPSRLQLGAAVYRLAVIAAVAGLPSVDAVEVIEARRLSDPPAHGARRDHVRRRRGGRARRRPARGRSEDGST